MQNNIKSRLAVILLNMGGPGSLKEVEPFLFNLFSDPAIINLPSIIRIPLAKFISLSRVKKAKKIYSKIGGKSPICIETMNQQKAVTEKLNKKLDTKVFVCMRYTNPNSKSVIKEIIEFDPKNILLLPLYPQFSSTTTASSIKDFLINYHIMTKNMVEINTARSDKIYNVKSFDYNANVRAICCYPNNNKFIDSHVFLLKKSFEKLKDFENLRILFSAHSLPIKIIKAGDPYKWQIEQTVENIIKKLNIKNLDYKITYQSKIGPLEWLTPATDKEVIKAGIENKSLIIVPISFVSEHSETLVELDIDYKILAEKFKIQYIRLPALSINEIFISALNEFIENFIEYDLDKETGEFINNRICPAEFKLCPNKCIK